MSNNILDQVEKYTGSRTCPECGYQLPFGRFVSRFVMSYGFLKWSCQNCGESIKFNFIKLQLLWFAGLVVFGGLMGGLMFYLDLKSFNFIYMLPYFVFVLLTLYYARFQKEK
ncbi:MAG: hypothetical protein AAFO82_19955 [Bacteroidota bacterium]